jgi:hypothetical protein
LQVGAGGGDTGGGLVGGGEVGVLGFLQYFLHLLNEVYGPAELL